MSPATPPRSPRSVSKTVRSAKRKASLKANARRARSDARALVNKLNREIPRLMIKAVTVAREENRIRYEGMLAQARANLEKAVRRAARSGSRGE